MFAAFADTTNDPEEFQAPAAKKTTTTKPAPKAYGKFHQTNTAGEGRTETSGRGRGRGRGRGGRGGRGRGGRGRGGPRGARAVDRDNRGEHEKGERRHDGSDVHHGRKFDKQPGSGYKGRDYGRKHGHEKGDETDIAKKVEHTDADTASNAAEGETEEETYVAPVVEEVNNLTYKEIQEELKAKRLATKTARAPEAIKTAEKIEQVAGGKVNTFGVETNHSELTNSDTYAPNKASDILAFNTGAQEEEEVAPREDSGRGRGRGRGRGGRGGRGGQQRGGARAPAGPRKARKQQTAAVTETDFPSLG